MDKQNTPTFSKRVLDALRQAGWTTERDEASIEQDYVRAFGFNWVPAASRFVRSFGGLSIRNLLWVRPIETLANPAAVQRIKSVIQTRVCPIAASNYMGDGCSVWIDENGRFYAVDSEGMVYVGSDTATALEVLLFGASPPLPPAELKQALTEAYEWKEE